MNDINLLSFDVSKVTDMKYMFAGCHKIKEIDLNSQQAEARYLSFIKKLAANDTNAQLYIKKVINI